MAGKQRKRRHRYQRVKKQHRVKFKLQGYENYCYNCTYLRLVHGIVAAVFILLVLNLVIRSGLKASIGCLIAATSSSTWIFLFNSLTV